MKKKLIILGAGENQVPIIKLAKLKNYYTIAVSIDGDYPGFKLSDKKYITDVREKEYILDIARKEQITGILTDQTDIAVPTAAYVAENLGLPGIGYECALNFTNKFRMRKSCENTEIKTIGFRRASNYREADYAARELGLPLIIKPVDNQGSRGVGKVDRYSDLKEKFDNAVKYSATKSVIIEEFFQGREIVIEGFAKDYKFHNLIIGDSENFESIEMFIPKQRIFPTTLSSEIKAKVLSANRKLIEKLGLKFGITHSEFLVNETNGDICLMEIAARGGGVFISSDLIPLACGINVNELLIELSAGENPDFDMKDSIEASSGYICFLLPEGTITKVEGLEEVNKLPGVHRACLENIQLGRKTLSLKDKTSRLGPILISAENRNKLEAIIQDVKMLLNIEVETANGTRGIMW
jgi:carbamoyl-phosphate synthase large subunit